LSAQIKIDASAAGDATAPASSDAAATAKIAVQAAATAAVVAPVKQQASQTVATAVTNVALATAVAATAPVVAKTTALKTPVAAPAKTAASDAPDIAPGTADPSATAAAAPNNVAQQPAVAGKPEAGNGIVDAANASATSSSTSAAIVAPHEHSPVTTAAHTLTDSSDAGVQATGTIQPQLPALAATALAGPLNVTPATNAAVPLSGLALEIAVSARSGKSRFEIRLDPADLGRIDVRIDVDRNGQVTSHLTVEKPETLSMLRQDAPQLQRQLDDAGFKTGNGGLQFSLRDQSSSGQNSGNETGRNAQRLVISDEDTIPAAVAGRTYGRMLGSSSGVDIRV
jgi:flagellar hook-length control protein FliK